ncbi:MAG: DUF3352 domain-containing protein [Synechococcales bacterium]|nr:DUF3352 domain-containing protein [Synechococcales bacterium]
MKLKNLFRKKFAAIALPIAGAALLIVGGSLAFWVLTRSRFAPGNLPVGATVIPKDALMVMTLTTDEGEWRRLRSFGTEKSQTELDRNLAQFRDRFLTVNNLNYEQDIQPWVGPEVTLAMLSPQVELATPKEGQTAQPPSPQPTVLVLPIASPLKAKELLDNPKEIPGRKWSDRTYKDIKIRRAEGNQPNQTLEVAAFDAQLLVVTNSARAMERTIDALKGEAALADTPGYANALGQIQTGRTFASLYFNVPETILSSNANTNRKLPQSNVEQVQQSQGWATTANLEPDGIKLQSIFWLKPDSQRKFSQRNTAKTMVSRLPNDTLLMTSGGDLKQFWEDYSRDYATYPVKLLDPAGVQEAMKGTLGMDWREDFIQWMQGEFSFSLVTAPAGSDPTTPIGMVFMVQSSDRRAAEKALKQLDEVMAKKYNFQIEETQLEGQTVTNWQQPASPVNITRGWLDGNVAFISVGAPVAKTFLPRPRTPLNSNPTFQQAVIYNPDQTNGQFFADLDRAATFKSVPFLGFLQTNQVWLDAMRSIGLNSVVTSDRTTRYEAKVLLKSAGNPQPFPSPTIPSASPAPKLPPSSASPTPKP